AVEVIDRLGLWERVPVLFSPSFEQVAAQDLARWLLQSRRPARLQLQLHKIVWGPEARGVRENGGGLTMKRPCYVVDAFSDRPLLGNSAGVVLDGRELPTAQMQRIAAELKHSETAFPLPAREPQAAFHLRWFTPAAEVRFCGHATLAA